jgi:hypothetical protein
MECRAGCGACCTVVSISTPIPTVGSARAGTPAMPKPAGERCVQLGLDGRCGLFGSPLRPEVCGRLQPEPQMCGGSTREAVAALLRLQRMTRPGAPAIDR